MAVEAFIKTILLGDVDAATRIIQIDPTLARGFFRRSRLYTPGVFHWICVGDTLLHLAAAGHQVKIVRLLLDAGADPNAAGNRRRSTPLHYAAEGFITGPAWDSTQQVQTIQCLLRQGARLGLQDMNGATPLHRAVRTRCAAAVRLLLQAGADPTTGNKPGSTPFHLAAQTTGRGGSGAESALMAQHQIIRESLAVGVPPSAEPGNGKTVLGFARSPCIRKVLPEATARPR